MANQGESTRDPSTTGSQESENEEKKYTEKELNEKVSSILGAKLGPIPSQTLDFFREKPGLLNEMLLTHSIVKNDSKMNEKIQALIGDRGRGSAGAGGLHAEEVDVDKILRESEVESGVEMADDTRKVLRAFGMKISQAHARSAKTIAENAFHSGVPDALKQATREEQWDFVREQEDYKNDPVLRRLTRDKVQEAFVTKSDLKPIQALEETRKEVLALRGGKPFTPGSVPGTSSQPKPTAPFSRDQAQAAGSTQGNQAQQAPAPRVSKFKQAAESISRENWEEMIRGVSDKRSGG